MDRAQEEEKPILNMNVPAEESCSSGVGLHLHDENPKETGDGGDLRGTERENREVETTDSSARKSSEYGVEEKGKAKIDSATQVNLDLTLSLGIDYVVLDLEKDGEEGDLVLRRNVDVNAIDLSHDNDGSNVNLVRIDSSPAGVSHGGEFVSLGPRPVVKPDKPKSDRVVENGSWEAYLRKRQARELARFKPLEKQESHDTTSKLGGDFGKEFNGISDDDSESPFALAMEEIRKREKGRKKSDSMFKSGPANQEGCDVVRKRHPPRLLDLCLNILAKNAERIESLDFVPDEFRSRISLLVSGTGKVNAPFVKLLTSGCPTEIRVKDISKLTEEELTKIFCDCDTKYLTVLQLDLCGRSMSDYVLRDTLASSSNRLAALLTISLRGAYRLSDTGLVSLAKAAPALQSVNLSQCSLLTSHGIIDLVSCLTSTLTELYIDDCENVDCIVILPALKKLNRLEVLSVAGNHTVSDEFVVGIVRACGLNMRELGLANCVKLTDISLKFVGEFCPKLHALDLCYLNKLTDSALKYLANGCQSIHSLKFCRSHFSDDAVAAFLEVSGKSLTVLSLNNIRKVAHNTAFSIAKCSRNLLSLDLSWCRNLSEEFLGLIVDSCPSLKLLVLFGCSQVTDVFLEGHSNKLVTVIGCKTEPILKHCNVLGC